MAWELADATAVRGPYEDEQVIALLERGLDPATVVRRVGQEEWRSLRTHPPFAMAIERASQRSAPAAAQAAAPTPPQQQEMPWWQKTSGIVAIIGGALGLVMATAIAAAWPSRKPPTATACPPGHYCDESGREIRLPSHDAPAPPKAQEPSLAAKILAIRSQSEAVSTIRPMMADGVNEPSPGATILAIWMWNNGKWSDLVVKDETTFGKIQKDPDAERGKRYCASGSLIEIAAQKFDGGQIDVGLLMDDSMRLFHFMSAGSSGSLVAQSPARFCGVVVGKYDYSNSAGGTGHAVEIVGMFDLPENRKKR